MDSHTNDASLVTCPDGSIFCFAKAANGLYLFHSDNLTKAASTLYPLLQTVANNKAKLI